MSLPEEGTLKGSAIITGALKVGNLIDTSTVANMRIYGAVMVPAVAATAQVPKKYVMNNHWHRHTFERPRRKGK